MTKKTAKKVVKKSHDEYLKKREAEKAERARLLRLEAIKARRVHD